MKIRMPRSGWATSLLLVSGAILVACDATSQSAPPPDGVATPVATGGANIADRYHGMAIQLTQGPGALDVYLPLIREIADLGADTLLLCPAAQMEHAKAQAIFIDARRTPSQSDLVEMIAEARRVGMRTILMPIVLLRHPRGSEWRGVIEPPEWKDWWRDYKEFARYFAQVAQDGAAEGFIVGSELVSTEKSTSDWLEVIEQARAIYPSGKLGYSANWDHYKPVKFWDKLDFIGMTTYYTLADQRNPSIDQIVERWRPVRDKILEWAREVKKPLIFTEVGWCSQEGAATAPWNYYQNMSANPEGHEEQRRLYEAFLKAWDTTPELKGVFWWEWTTSPGGPDDFNYTPRNKPAEQVLRRWFETARTNAAAPAQP